jgi:hypothetical protein
MSDIMAQAGDAEQPDGISRRTVLKGAAWSVPAIMVATQLPAYATGTPDLTIDFPASSACKIPGNSWGEQCFNKGYVLWAEIVNNTGQTVYLTGVSFMSVGGVTQCVAGFAEPLVSCSTLQQCVSVAPGTTTVAIFSNAATDSASNTVVVNLDYNLTGCGDAGTAQSGNLSGNVVGNPWPNTQGGSCQFPPGACPTGRTPPNICGTPCDLGATAT